MRMTCLFIAFDDLYFQNELVTYIFLFKFMAFDIAAFFLLFLYAVVRGKGKSKQLDYTTDEEDTEEQTSDEEFLPHKEVSKGIIEADAISNPPKKFKTKKLAGRKPIEVTSSSVPKDSHERHAQSQYDLRVKDGSLEQTNDEREDVEQHEDGEEKLVCVEKGAMPINDEREPMIGVVQETFRVGSMHDQDIEKGT
ncbi:hypothetical protein RHMOL_Rhmol09G0025500 [Rhododendron molle]|uniref:Uncharacterized protein n=1 Tax=Rhododendron molle TaxID=49168 RepID=A0ACC0MA84_RHOML|nr:hypothetical protein RHMOL_Rhmol09G0025500 [Rhododendron molle]